MKQILFLATMICSLAVFAADIDVNGDFKKVKDGIPAGWRQNKGKWAKPFGKVEIVDNALKITNTDKTKRTDVYFVKNTPITAGDTVKVTVKLKGKGTVGVGVYVYGAKKWCDGQYKNTKLNAETTEFTVSIVIKNKVKNGEIIVTAKAFRAVVQAVNPNTEVTIESVKVETTPAK